MAELPQLGLVLFPCKFRALDAATLSIMPDEF